MNATIKHAVPGTYEDMMGAALIFLQKMKKSAPKVEGYSWLEPVPDEDWEDVVRWEVNQNWYESASDHNRSGFFAEEAWGTSCIALGHKQPDDYDEDAVDDSHPYGWDHERLCLATRYGVACTECESEDCPVMERATDTSVFWKLFEARS